jgi:2-methylcitrate dehydratase PrpD
MSAPESPTPTRALARFLADARVEDLPAIVRHEAKRSLLNFFACALSGCGDQAIVRALRVLDPWSGPRQAAVIGHRARLDALNAGFLNAASANVEDFDDTHIPTIIHPTAPVAGALLAWAEHRPTTGAALLHALALGVDIECRVGNAVSPSHYRRGWHITSTCGVFGAAAAVGKLLGLDETGLVWALGNAAVQAGGLVESLGSMSKSISVGNAARNGIAAALFAAQGVAAAEQAIEGERGFASVTADPPDLGALTRDLGAVWEIRHNTYKPYPCGVVLFPVIDACLVLRARHHLAPGQIARVAVTGHPLLRERADRPDVTTGREAKVSLQHSVAVALIDGAAGVRHYTDSCVADPAVLALRAKVAMVEDAAIGVEAAEVTVHTRDGRALTERVSQPRGGLERPLSDAELEAKLRELAADATPWCEADRLIDAVWTLDRAAAVDPVMALVTPPAS